MRAMSVRAGVFRRNDGELNEYVSLDADSVPGILVRTGALYWLPENDPRKVISRVPGAVYLSGKLRLL